MSTPVVEPEPRPAPQLPPATPTLMPQLKSPGLAFFLSFLFPGIGQVYNGQPAKALVFFAAFVASLMAVIKIDPLPFVFLLPFVWLYNLVDAWRTAALINARGTAADLESPVESPAWGVSLIALGTLFLLNNFGWLDLSRVARYWPLLLIAAGGAVLYRSFQKKEKGSDAQL